VNQPNTLFLPGGPGLSAVVEPNYMVTASMSTGGRPHFEVQFARRYQAAAR